MFAEQSLVMTPSTPVTRRLIIVVISEGAGGGGECLETAVLVRRAGLSVLPCVCLDTDQGR